MSAKRTERARLRLEDYRCWTKWASLDAASKKQMADFQFLLEDSEEFAGPIERVDVIDTRDAKVVYQLFLWPFGSGVLLHAGTARVAADIVQHAFVVREPDGVPLKDFGALRESIGAAFDEGKARLGIKEGVSFNVTLAEKNPAPATAAKTGSVAARIVELRTDAAAGKPHPDVKATQALVAEALGLLVKRTEYRPFPVRRLFELDATQQNALELMADLNASNGGFPRHGLPEGAGPGAAVLTPFGYWHDEANDLMRFLRRGPLLPLDELVEVDGQSHPAWMLVSDALYELRKVSEVTALLARALSSDRLLDLWEALFKGTEHDLRSRRPPTAAEDSKGQSGPSIDAHLGRFVELLVAMNVKLGDAGHARAKQIVAELEKMTKGPDPFEVIAGLECLAARGALDPRHDELLATAVLYCAREWRMTGPFAHLLEQLPRDRASRIAGIHLPLVERFPSADAAARLVARLEAPDQRGWEGPYWDKAFRKAFVDGLGSLATAALTEAVARSHPRTELLADCLARIEKKAAKKPAKPKKK